MVAGAGGGDVALHGALAMHPSAVHRGNPWLSVLVAACDVAPYIDAAMASVLSQADAGVELVVVDDASTDGTGGRLERIASTDARVRITRHARNLGVASTRSELVAAARGDYLWFLDGDDMLAPGAIERLRATLARRPVDLVLCDFRVWDVPPWRRRRRASYQRPGRGCDAASLVAGSLEAGQLHVWSKIARRELWMQAPFAQRGRFEDMAAVAHLLALADSWHHVAEPWVLYRRRAGSLSHALPASALMEHADAMDDVARVLAPCLGAGVAREPLDYFLLRGHAAIARRVRGLGVDGDGIASTCCRRFLAAFPDGGEAALAACRRRGWWLRAWRIARALDGAGWRGVRPR